MAQIPECVGPSMAGRCVQTKKKNRENLAAVLFSEPFFNYIQIRPFHPRELNRSLPKVVTYRPPRHTETSDPIQLNQVNVRIQRPETHINLNQP
jgi:hypothetical protein